jgi:lysophospholipase L1-like esterase
MKFAGRVAGGLRNVARAPRPCAHSNWINTGWGARATESRARRPCYGMTGGAPVLRRSRWLAALYLFLFTTCRASLAQLPSPLFKFSFAPTPEDGYTVVTPTTAYSKDRGFGFEDPSGIRAIDRQSPNGKRDGFCTSDKPFYFSVALPEGNYNVTVFLGDPAGESDTTIKAELRRLMVERVRTAPAKLVTRTFTVNVRTPHIAGDGQVRLKDREKTTEIWDWDEKLTLEFNGPRPCLMAMEIEKAAVPTIFILGDSTVCDQPREPWNSWGQMLPRFFRPGIAIANHAESGESLRSSLSAHRLDKVLSLMKSGDYLFIQYGHNDMKERGPNIGAFTSYSADLKKFVDGARSKGGIPVLITSMNRKSFNDTGIITNTLGDYPDAVRKLAKEEKVALIDLNAMSKTLYEAIGRDNIGKAFVDGTHHNAYGSYELAKCVAEGIRQNKLEVAKFLMDDVPAFDPAKPDSIADFNIPPSPMKTTAAPDGN